MVRLRAWPGQVGSRMGPAALREREGIKARIKHFVPSLLVDPDGSTLELRGEPMLRVLPPVEED